VEERKMMRWDSRHKNERDGQRSDLKRIGISSSWKIGTVKKNLLFASV
jgi:hypothetical protein